MASIALRLPDPSSVHLDPNPNPSRLPLKTPAFLSASVLPACRRSPSSLCRCRGARSDSPTPPGDESGRGSGGGGKRWDELIQGMVAKAVKRWDDYVKSYRMSQSQMYSEGLGSENTGDFRGEVREEEVKEEECEKDWDWERWKRHFAEMEELDRVCAPDAAKRCCY